LDIAEAMYKRDIDDKDKEITVLRKRVQDLSRFETERVKKIKKRVQELEEQLEKVRE